MSILLDLNIDIGNNSCIILFCLTKISRMIDCDMLKMEGYRVRVVAPQRKTNGL